MQRPRGGVHVECSRASQGPVGPERSEGERRGGRGPEGTAPCAPVRGGEGSVRAERAGDARGLGTEERCGPPHAANGSEQPGSGARGGTRTTPVGGCRCHPGEEPRRRGPREQRGGRKGARRLSPWPPRSLPATDTDLGPMPTGKRDAGPSPQSREKRAGRRKRSGLGNTETDERPRPEDIRGQNFFFFCCLEES